ncbi:uncharacterized protein LOC108093441 [Drosophila ficusphila]|uniref:uncharacterized protein LOC108093441 n=1 Tax=Drosophila ficusphila TaxID=30025 RepID=UPI0007E831B9|nr:uncharacterized protein LOC108093441 [Drosophila ficusphila]
MTNCTLDLKKYRHLKTVQSCFNCASDKFITEKMRKVHLSLVFAIALLGTAIASLAEEAVPGCSQFTEVLESRLKAIEDTLHQRLTSFENRLTQWECSKKVIVPIKDSSTFNDETTERNLLDQTKITQSHLNAEIPRNPNINSSIGSRIKDIYNDLAIIAAFKANPISTERPEENVSEEPKPFDIEKFLQELDVPEILKNLNATVEHENEVQQGTTNPDNLVKDESTTENSSQDSTEGPLHVKGVLPEINNQDQDPDTTIVELEPSSVSMEEGEKSVKSIESIETIKEPPKFDGSSPVEFLVDQLIKDLNAKKKQDEMEEEEIYEYDGSWLRRLVKQEK